MCTLWQILLDLFGCFVIDLIWFWCLDEDNRNSVEPRMTRSSSLRRANSLKRFSSRQQHQQTASGEQPPLKNSAKIFAFLSFFFGLHSFIIFLVLSKFSLWQQETASGEPSFKTFSNSANFCKVSKARKAKSFPGNYSLGCTLVWKIVWTPRRFPKVSRIKDTLAFIHFFEPHESHEYKVDWKMSLEFMWIKIMGQT